MSKRDEIAARLVAERARQFDLPGIEFDARNGPNDWAAIIGHYLFGEVERGPERASRVGFEDRLVKAGAVILAALEHCDLMERADRFVA